MKHLFTILFLSSIFATTGFSQITCQPPTYAFNNMSVVSGSGGVNSVYKFSNVLSGFDAFVTITKLQNATMSNGNMDQSSGYAQSWQPYVTFPSSRSNNADSSYAEFKIEFKSSSTGFLANQSCMSMTIIDLDGNSNYREMVKVSNPGIPLGIQNSTISVNDNIGWMTFISGTATFNNIDSSDKAAMSQVNFPPTINTVRMRVGVLGRISSNTTRQFSFYFKSFTGLVVPLPVHVTNLNSALIDDKAQLFWNSADETNFSHFEVYRSFNGIDFESTGIVNASMKKQAVNSYSFIDPNPIASNHSTVFYKLKLVDNNGEFAFTPLTVIDNRNSTLNTLSNVYPNPATTQLNVDLGYIPYDDFNVTVMDIYGKVIFSQDNPVLNGTISTLDISNFENGIYIVKVAHADGSVISTKITKF